MARRVRWQLADQMVPHSHADKPTGTNGELYRLLGKTASLTGESVGGAHRILELTQAHLPGNQHQGSTSKDSIFLWEVGEVTESRVRDKQVALFPL